MNKFPYNEVRILLDEADNIKILTHINPDADTIGTGLGIYNMLKDQKVKKIEIVNTSNALPHYLNFLPSFDKIKSKMEYKNGLVIACDCGSIDRFGADIAGRTILNIDHHESNTYYGTVNCVKPEYSSASHVAFELFKKIYKINERSATCFYAALLSDTRYFTAGNVNRNVFIVAEELVETGADPVEVAYNFTQRRSLASLRILEKAFSNLALYYEARVAVLSVSQDDIITSGAIMSDMDGIVDYGRSLATVEIGFFVMQLSDGIRVSLRSKRCDVAKLAAVFGGGGHKQASGFTLKDFEIKEIIDRILKKIEELGILNEA